MIRAIVLSAAILLAGLSESQATTYYVSNAANNGYASGSDSNNCTAKATPCLTISHATSLTNSNGADSVVVNPGTGAYVESAGSGFLNMNYASLITGEPTLCGSVAGPTTVPTIQSTESTRVINVPSGNAFNQTLACMTIDPQSGGSRRAVLPSTNQLLTLRQVNFVNAASFAVGNITGTSAHVYDRIQIDSSNTTGNSFGWYDSTAMTSVTINGGIFANSPASRQVYFSGTFPSITIGADVNGALPLFTGTTGAYPVQFSGATVTNATISVACNSTVGCIEMDGGTVANWTIQNSTFTNVTTYAGVFLLGPSCTLGQLKNNTMVSGSARGLFEGIAENCNMISSGNVVNPTAGNSFASGMYRWAMGTAFTSTNDRCNMPTNGPRVCFEGGSDGWLTDASNTGASNGSQNIGDVSGNTYVDQFWTTQTATSSSRAPYLAAVDFYLKKAGSPVGNVTVSIYADSAGQPTGAALATSAAVAAASLTTSIQQFHFVFASPLHISANTKYHAVVNYSGAINGTDYVVLDRNSTTTIGSIYTSANGSTWTADAAHALRSIFQTGFYGMTMVYTNPTIIYNDATDTRELEGINSAANNGITVNGMICINCGYFVVVKNTLGNSYVYNSLGTSYGAMAQNSGFYSKSSVNAQFWHNVCIQGGSENSQCVVIGGDSTSAVNKVQSSNPTVKDNIWITNAASTPYKLDPATTGTIGIDYNDVFPAGTVIDAISSDTWAQWQTAGYDTHSILGNPRLKNGINPTTFADISPLAISPVKGRGIGTGSPTPIDALGNQFSPPSIGAIQYRHSCLRHAGRLLCN